jgi:protein-disulfide isomerase
MSRFSLILPVLALFVGNPCQSAEAPAPTRSDRGSSALQGAAPPTLGITSAEPVVRIDPSRGLGSPSATIAIVEFGDYQCPYCRAFHVSTLPKLHEVYVKTGKVRYFYKDFPLSNHQHAFGASATAYCAGRQKRYWQMQELLYTEQARLGPELYNELVKELGLNIEEFKACLRSDAVGVAISGDVADGRSVGINSTPSFVLGIIREDQVVVKRMAAGAPSFEVFAKEIESLSR